MLKAQYLVNRSGENLELLNQPSGSIRKQAEDITPSSSQSDLGLPEGFAVGKAVSGGDCFFDAVAQGLKQLKPEMNFTVKSLRKVCKVFAKVQHTSWLEESLKNNNSKIAIYIPRIEFTADDIKEGSRIIDILNLTLPIWGRPEIEGRIICGEYNVTLHFIERHVVEGQEMFVSHIVNSEHLQSVRDVDYDDGNTIHVVNRGYCHFEPILKKTAQQMLPHSNLIQNHSRLNEPSFGNIPEMQKNAKLIRDVLLISNIEKEFINIIENSNLLEEEKLKELKSFFQVYPRLNVNFYVNEYNDTPLHGAVYRKELKIAKFLLKKGAYIDTLNEMGKTPIDLAENNNREDIVKILQPLVSYKEVDVPGNGSCLFWSVALAYLTSVKFDDDTFCKRFEKLFSGNCDMHAIQKLIQQGNADIYKNNTLRELVTRVFRSGVVNEISLSKKELSNDIEMEDFLEIHNGGYFTEGIFKKEFENKFGAKKIKQYNIDINKLQPNFFDENAVKEICTELNKMRKCNEVQQFIFQTYLQCMRMPESWCGEYEVKTISKLLETAIIVSQKGLKDSIYNEGKKYCNKIHLSYKGGQHYQFRQVSYSNLVNFVLNFVQSFEINLIIYNIFASTLERVGKIHSWELATNKFVLNIFGFNAYVGSKVVSNVKESLKTCNVIKATKGFVNLSDLIETFNKYKLGFRKVLVDAACDIFQSFEMQFEEISFNQVSKIADDIVDKIIEYYIQKEHKEKLSESIIVNALVSDQCLQKRYNRMEDNNLRDLYENIGIAVEEKDSFIYYKKNDGDKSSQYGYRRFFIDEGLEVAKHGYRQSIAHERMKAVYTKVETANEKIENYVYALDSQDFKDIIEKVFYIVNEEIQVPSIKRIEDFVVKVKSHVEQEVSFLRQHVSFIKKTGQSKKDDVISLMEEKLKEIPDSCYYLKAKEIFISRAETISQDYSSLFESQCDDTMKSGSLWSRIKTPSVKALAFLFERVNFKDVCAPVEEFTGRQKQIEEIYKKLQEGAAVIMGPSGIGKTQLARKFVDENKEIYLHAYEVNTQDMLSIESSFTSFVRDELAMSMEEERGNKVRKKCLFLFEGAKKEDVGKILKIRRKRGGFDCLFTSSDRDYQDIAEVALDNLEEEQAEQLVKKILEIADKSQDEQIETLVRKLKSFPLAIKQAAACIKNRKSSAPGKAFGIYEYLIQYKNFDQELPRISEQNEYDRVLQITSLISVKAIQEVNSKKEVLGILNTIAYFGSSQIDPNLFLVWIEEEGELYSVFELLEQYSMISTEERDKYKVYVMHELIKKAIRSQISIDKEKQVLSRAIKLMYEDRKDFYKKDGDFYKRNMNHFLSLFDHSQEHENLVRESCYLACTVIGILNMLCKHKEALTFASLEAFKILITVNEDIVIAKYEIANAMTALGQYDLALKILLDLKRQNILSNIFPPLSLDKEIIFTYFKQKRYKDVLSYLKSDNFLLIKLPDEKDQFYLENYLSIVTTVAEVFIMQKRYTDAFTMLHYARELRDEFFFKRSDFDSYSDPYLDPSDLYEFYNLETKYNYALACFFTSQDRKKITINEEMLPNKEDLPRELSIPILSRQLQDILKNQEGSQYLQPAPYSIKENVSKVSQRILRNETLQRFEAVLQLQKGCGFLESHSRVLSVKFYIALLHSYLGDRERALQELQQLQEVQEKVIGINHPDTLATIDAVQELFTEGQDRSIYLRNEMGKRELLLQFEKSDLNAHGVLTLKEIYAKKNSNGHPSVNASPSRGLLPEDKRSMDTENTQNKRRKINNQQQVSSCLDSVNVDFSRIKQAAYSQL